MLVTEVIFSNIIEKFSFGFFGQGSPVESWKKARYFVLRCNSILSNGPFNQKDFIITQKFDHNTEIADIFHQYGDEFVEKYPQSPDNHSQIKLIKICRTSSLGGHLQRCGQCDFARPMYNSCRCRMCPKCQALKKERWVESRKKEILPCHYFHGVFTLPHDLNRLALNNKKIIYSILFESVAKTLQEFAQGELGGKLGFISVFYILGIKS